MNIRSPAEVRAKQEEAVLARFWIRPRGAVPLIVSEIAERTGVSRQIIGQILVRLTHAGLITATPTSISGKGTSRISRTTLPLSVVTVFWLLPLRRFGG